VNDRHVGAIAVLASAGMAALLALSGAGAGPVLLASAGTALLGVGLVSGSPAMVPIASTLQLGAIAWSATSTHRWGAVALAAPLLWVAAEAGWRSFDLRPRVRARSVAASSWVGFLLGSAIATAGFAVVVSGLGEVAPDGGLAFRALALVAVVGAAGMVTLVARRRLPGR
jgi:hypothetical protein